MAYEDPEGDSSGVFWGVFLAGTHGMPLQPTWALVLVPTLVVVMVAPATGMPTTR